MRAVVVAGSAAERRGGTSEIAVSVIRDLEIDADGLGERSDQGGCRHRRERGKEAGAGEPPESVGEAGLTRCRAC